MFMPFAFLLLLVTVPLAGGRLSRLADLRLEGVHLVVLALALQVLMASVLPFVAPDAPHLLLIAIGGGTNAAVIALNGGTLPADPEALAAAGFSPEPDEYKNSGVVDDPVLAWLGDVMTTPAWLPFRNVISLGDLVVLVGGAVLLHVVCASRVGRVLGTRARRGECPRSVDPSPVA